MKQSVKSSLIFIGSIFFIILSGIFSSINKNEHEGAIINERTKTNDVLLRVESSAKTYLSYKYAFVGNELSDVYSAGGKNKTFFFAKSVGDNNFSINCALEEDLFDFSYSTIAIQDYGVRNIDSIGIKLLKGKLNSKTPKTNECFLPLKIATYLLNNTSLNSLDELLLDETKLYYKGYELHISGIIDDKSIEQLTSVLEDFIVISINLMMYKDYGNVFLCSSFGGGTISIASYLKAMKCAHPIGEYLYSITEKGVYAPQSMTMSYENYIQLHSCSNYVLSILFFIAGVLLFSLFCFFKYYYLKQNSSISFLSYSFSILFIVLLFRIITSFTIFDKCISLFNTTIILTMLAFIICICIFTIVTIKNKSVDSISYEEINI